MEKATAEIFHFKCRDIITTSEGEHDNGFIDGDELARAIKNIAKDIADKF